MVDTAGGGRYRFVILPFMLAVPVNNPAWLPGLSYTSAQ
jgi:hypothetical protein